jgi:hypothetical protein
VMMTAKTTWEKHRWPILVVMFETNAKNHVYVLTTIFCASKSEF